MAKINPDKKQVEYWQGRNERTFLEGEKDILDYAESLKKQYTGAANRIEEEIQKFYGKFAVDNNYTMADLKKLLNRDELKSFKESIKDIAAYAKEHKLDKDFETQIKILRAKSKISRLDELKTKINFEVEKLYSDVNDSLGEQLQKSFEDGYYKTIFNQQKFLGFSDNFAMLNQKAIQKAVTTPYMTENYSDVLWKNKTNLMNILNQQIPQGIILGYNPNKTAKIASQQLGSKYKSTTRLIRTEYNLILNDATAQGYKEAGIEKYQILATLDSRTSDICREMDGEIFKIKEKEVGINYPPFHPNCRTTTIPYFEPDEFDTEIEEYIKDEDGIKHKITDDTQYEEWKNALKPKKDGTAIYENNNINTQATSNITEWKNFLSTPEIDALQNYSFKEYGDTSVANYEDINNYLRFNQLGKVPEATIKNTINYIESALNKFELDKDIVVYRGIDVPTIIEQVIGEKKYSRDVNIINSYLKNTTFTDKGFVSTSISKKEAINFGMGSGRAVMRINIPSGTKGAYIDEVSKIKREKEFLLNRNVTFKINNVKYDAANERFIINCNLVRGD